MSPTFTTQTYATAQEFLEACAPALEETRAMNANLPLSSSYAAAKSNTPSTTKEWWISVASPSPSDSAKTALFTLTVLGTFPGGLASSVDPKSLTPEFLKAAMQALVSAADAEELPVSRLSSVTAPRALVEPFSDAWASAHNLKPLEKPLITFYHALATKDTLRPPVRPKLDNVTTGKVRMDELDIAGEMLVRFSYELPRQWSLESAKKFAAAKIEEGALFAARVDGELKSIAALTRPTPGVKAIAQVFTDENTRGKGLAELVTREAVRSTLEEPGLKALYLFVSPENPVAARVYGRIGFIGLETGVPDERTEEWAELGWEGVKLLDF